MTSELKSEWLEAARPELDRLTGDNADLKRATIISLVTAEILNTRMIWGQGSGNCARSTWKSKWSKEPLTAEVYGRVKATIQQRQAGGKLDAVAEASAIIQEAAPEAARTLVALLGDPSPMISRLAAESILDRASLLTAPKQGGGELLTADRLAELARQARAEVAIWESAQDEPGGAA